jgi:hypothetical protein
MQMALFHRIRSVGSLAVGLISTCAWVGLLGYGLIRLF